MKKILKTSAFIAVAAASLSACASTQKHTVKYSAMSCMQLAEEIGKQKAIRTNSKVDEFIADVDLVFSDSNADAVAAGIEGLAHNAVGQDSKRRLTALRDLSERRGC